ncbi:glycosyl transferase family 1 [Photobacterium sanctipauli]|uniref:Glycosyl transferase family 1 n=1 Tax=Photobacterium sanctipauli TaxID=1342794 RepID=A0A2T3NSI1_9GAMM|nr:glycosyltransferase family 4 protein [Photobacterium sanctipauli]PSW19165.1 glycosyl transferase family 1 [Photobacterium sanctipauli]
MVYLLVDSSGFGGIESHIQQLALLLRSQRIEVEVVYLRHYPSHPQYAQLERQQIPYRFLSSYSLIGFFKNLAATDVVHAHGYKASILSRCCRLLARYHLVTTYHAGESVSGRLACYEWLNRYTGWLSYNLAVSTKIKRHQPFHCELLRNFVACDGSPPNRQRHSQLQVGFVGRLSHEKGIDRFIAINQHTVGCEFHVYGDGEQSYLLEGAGVKWHGAVPSMVPHWQELDVLLITSRAEGMPMAALEAMSHGVVVISTDVGEMPALVDNCCLVAEDNWQQLSFKLEQCVNEPAEFWLALSRQQQQLVKANYSGEACWQQLAKIYRLHSASS